MPSITPAHRVSWPKSWAATPRSIAVPMTAGMTAWEPIQTMPKNMPASRVRH